jgi:hypothetical protein
LKYDTEQYNLINNNSFASTNNLSIATLTGYNKRTIQRHIKTLISAGLLTDKINKRGVIKQSEFKKNTFVNYNFKLFISNNFIVYKDQISKNEIENRINKEYIQNFNNEVIENSKKSKRLYYNTEKLKIDNSLAVLNCEKQFNNKLLNTKKAKETEDHENLKSSDPKFLFLCVQLANIIFLYSSKTIYSHLKFIALDQRNKATLYIYNLLITNTNEIECKKQFNKILNVIEYRYKWQKDKKINNIKLPAEYFSNRPDQFLNTLKFYDKIKNTDHIDLYAGVDTLQVNKLINSYINNKSIHNYLKINKKLIQLDNNEVLEKFYKIATSNYN